MGLNIFGWLRNQARQAVLGGVADALSELVTDDQPADLDQLRRMLATAGEAKALPVAKADAGEADAEPVKGKRGK